VPVSSATGMGAMGASGTSAVQAPPASAALAHALAEQRVQAETYYSTVGALVQDVSPAAVVQLVGAVRDRSAELKKKAGTDSEKAIIEVVALMFQSILSEDRIPPVVRVWFARLQVPVLRVALAEPEFFSNLNHPARQLIDRMGACVMGFDATSIGGSALEAEIRRVVQVIEQYPETGRRVFQLVHYEFEKFLAQFLTQKQSTSRVVSVAQQVEQKETLAIQYTIELRTMLKDMPVRDEIRDFLFKTWAEVLALSAVREGAQNADTLAFKQTAADLVWAASAKPHRSDRAQVIQSLPGLLQRLRQGLNLLGVQGAAQDVQVKALTDTLAEAFLSKTAAIPREHIDAMARRLANLEDFIDDAVLGDLPLDAESIEMMLGIDASAIHVVADNGTPVEEAMLDWARELQPGTWFTLDHNGARAQEIAMARSEWERAQAGAERFRKQVVARHRPRREEQLQVFDTRRQRQAGAQHQREQQRAQRPCQSAGPHRTGDEVGEHQVEQDVRHPVGSRAHAQVQPGSVHKVLPGVRAGFVFERHQAAIGDKQRPQDGKPCMRPGERALC